MSEMLSETRSTPWVTELQARWSSLATGARLEAFQELPRAEAEDFFCDLSAPDQVEILLALPAIDRRGWMRLLAPDDAADAVQAAPEDEHDGLLALLDDSARKEVTALLAYAEDEAGGLMSPRFARVRPDMTADEAISYLHKQARERVETIYYVYVLDAQQRLVGVVSFRQLFEAPGSMKVRDLMQTEVVTVSEQLDQEDVGLLFAKHSLLAIPVVDADRRMKGVVTVDDIVDVVQEEATEDIQKIGGMEALDEPYLDIGLFRILLWPTRATLYGEHYVLIAITVACSLIGIVLWGTISGSMLPLILRRLGFDPASASAPFVATLVDVTGLIIYFTVASVILYGTLL